MINQDDEVDLKAIRISRSFLGYKHDLLTDPHKSVRKHRPLSRTASTTNVLICRLKAIHIFRPTNWGNAKNERI